MAHAWSKPAAVTEAGAEHLNAGRHAQAVRCFRVGARLGYSGAQFGLGACHKLGHGVKAQSDVLAAQWLRAAADQGFAIAQDSLGDCYRQGAGVPQDHSKAALLFHAE